MINRILMLEKFTHFQRVSIHAIRLSKIELLHRYKRSFLGIWWALLNPIISVCVYYAIFSQVIRIEDFTKIEYLIYLVSGVIIINFSLQTITAIAENFSLRVNIITRIKIDPYTLAQGTLGASVFNFFMTFIPFFLLVLFNQGLSPRVIFLFPLICVTMFFLFGVGLALAVLYALFDDVKAITRIVFSFIPFLTPIFYKLDQLPDSLQHLISASPFTNILVLFRWCIGVSDDLQISVFWSLLLSLIFSFICIVFFKKNWNSVVKLL